MSFIVFYSNRCPYCDRLIKIIQAEQLVNNCQLICFESNPDKIPTIITNVPTIIAQNLSKQLIGLEAIEWVQNKKFFNQTTNNINNNNIIYPQIKSVLEDLAFNKLENTTISDRYTNIGDTDISKNMMEYNKINQNMPITNDLSNKKILDTKLTMEGQDEKIKELISLRKHQIQQRSTGTSKIN